MNTMNHKFENETGYCYRSCKVCAQEKCKDTGICNYYEKYAEWLEEKILEIKNDSH